ncbi:6385_t:CDS:1, partial [Racocetra fulgida]
MDYLSKEYYRAGATYLSPEVLEEIRNSREKIKNAVTTMTKKHHISSRRVYEIWRRCAMKQPDRIQQDEPKNQSSSSSTITSL